MAIGLTVFPSAMLRAANISSEVIFLASVLLGPVLLVTGIVVARLNWRSDAPRFLRTRSLDLLLRPGKFALPQVVPAIQVLNALGLLLIVVAALALIRHALTQFLF